MTQILTPDAVVKDADFVSSTAVANETAGQVLGLVIKDDAQFQSSTEYLRELTHHRKKLEDMRMGITRPMDDAKKAVMALFKPHIDKLADAENHLRRQTAAFINARNRERDEAQRAAAIRAADEAAFAELSGGDPVEAAVAVAAEPLPAVAKADGISMRSTWKAEVTDMPAFLTWVAEGAAERAGYVTPNMVALNGVARSLKGNIAIPGIKFIEEQGVAVR